MSMKNPLTPAGIEPLCYPGLPRGVSFRNYSKTPLIRKAVIQNSNYPDRLCPSGKFVGSSTKVNFLEIAGYRIKYSTVLWLLELQIRRGRKV